MLYYKPMTTYPCLKCDKVFTRKDNLETHITNNACKEYTHYCKFCNRGFTCETSMYRHVRTVCKEKKKNDEEKDEIYEKLKKMEEQMKNMAKEYKAIKKENEKNKKELTCKLEKENKELTYKLEKENKELTYKLEKENKELIRKLEKENKELIRKLEKELTLRIENENKELTCRIEKENKELKRRIENVEQSSAVLKDNNDETVNNTNNIIPVGYRKENLAKIDKKKISKAVQ
jgi:DNA repair exonuclease SbcCD ATPase subunit